MCDKTEVRLERRRWSKNTGVKPSPRCAKHSAYGHLTGVSADTRRDVSVSKVADRCCTMPLPLVFSKSILSLLVWVALPRGTRRHTRPLCIHLELTQVMVLQRSQNHRVQTGDREDF